MIQHISAVLQFYLKALFSASTPFRVRSRNFEDRSVLRPWSLEQVIAVKSSPPLTVKGRQTVYLQVTDRRASDKCDCNITLTSSKQ